ncbi:hypothetical protein OAH36_04340 [Verrucomicrobia bacterium]|nr:hypothetical protein [Verrucomicrobiota bacterium]
MSLDPRLAPLAVDGVQQWPTFWVRVLACAIEIRGQLGNWVHPSTQVPLNGEGVATNFKLLSISSFFLVPRNLWATQE